MKSGLLLSWSLLVGLFSLTSNGEAARATTLILGKTKPEPKIDVPLTAEDETGSEIVANASVSPLSNDTANNGNVTKLTGVPQIDYIYDPNLPRELNGYNLTDYPFYNSIPEDIDFKCDGLHDGFYASVPHKCQVYHHCLFGTRYDFLCANYTAFDQKTFICHFASEVDCKNSPRYFNRNEALYKATTTTTVSPFGASGFGYRRPQQDSPGGRRRRPHRKKKPSYDYYEDVDELSDDDYYDEGAGRRKKRPRNQNGKDSYDQPEEEEEGDVADKGLYPTGPNKSVYDRPRIAPKIRRPVPVNERDKYDYGSDSRAIVKEPTVEKKKFEDSETGRKHDGGQYESIGTGNAKNKEPETEREREHGQGGDYENERERDRERDRERERDRQRERDRDRDRERERDRDRDRDRERDREERPYRDRRPSKKRRRPDDIEDDYDEYEDVRRYRPSGRNRPRYDEYDDYEYDDRPYRRNRDPEYRSRDHDYDREKPHRSRDFDYDRPRPRDRIRDDDRNTRNRDIDDRPGRLREDDRPLRNREYEKSYDDRTTRNRNDQSHRSDAKYSKNRNRDGSVDGRHYYDADDDKYRDRDEDYNREEQTDKDGGQPEDKNKNQDKSSRFRESLDKFSRNRAATTRKTFPDENVKKPELVDAVAPVSGKTKTFERTDKPILEVDRPASLYSSNFRSRAPVAPPESEDSGDQSKPVPAPRPAFITKPPEVAVQQTQPFARKPFVETTTRKFNGFKRPLLPRIPLIQEEQTEIPQNQPESPNIYQQFEERPKATEGLEEDKLSYQPQEEHTEDYYPQPQSEIPNQKPKVPQEARDFSSDELAPRAPKVPQTPRRRRPFLPSRNGNSALPRGLLPVGGKAVNNPRGFADQSKRPEEGEAEGKTEFPPGSGGEQSENPNGYKSPHNGGGGGIEFRAKLSTAIGVDRPKLTQFFHDVQSDSGLDYREPFKNSKNNGPIPGGINEHEQGSLSRPTSLFPEADGEHYGSGVNQNQGYLGPSYHEQHQSLPRVNPSAPSAPDDHAIPNYRPESDQIFKPEPEINSNFNFRTTLKPTDFPELGDARHNMPPQVSPSHQDRRREEQQPLNGRHIPGLIGQQSEINRFIPKEPAIFHPVPVPPSAPDKQEPRPSHLAPPSFYSENPKFKTTIKVPSQFPYQSMEQHVNFNMGIHLPVLQANVRPHVGHRQVDASQENLKFPTQSDNLNDSDDYDVSLNDALQPISSLHPRNVATGIYLTHPPRNHQAAPSSGFNRRVHNGGPIRGIGGDQQEHAGTGGGGRQKDSFAPEKVFQESRNVPNQPKRFIAQREAASSVQPRLILSPVYHQARPVTLPANYVTILTQ